MTKESMKGYVYLFKQDKSLLATKKIRIYQHENCVDKISFLIPYTYEWINPNDSGFDMSNFTVTLNYLDSAGTVHSEILERYSHTDPSTGEIEYEDYLDQFGNPTHLIYRLTVDSKLTDLVGDYTLNLRLQYVDYEGQIDNPVEEPEAVLYQMSSGYSTITVLGIADYYSIIPADTLSTFIQQIDALKARADILENRADAQEDGLEDTRADLAETKENMVNDITLDEDKVYLQNSKNEQVGTEIELNDLGDNLAEATTAGLVKVITDDDDSNNNSNGNDNDTTNTNPIDNNDNNTTDDTTGN